MSVQHLISVEKGKKLHIQAKELKIAGPNVTIGMDALHSNTIMEVMKTTNVKPTQDHGTMCKTKTNA